MTDDANPQFPPQKRCISERIFFASLVFSVLLAVAAVYFWYDSVTGESRRLLKANIEEIRIQRDQVLDQRSILQRELDVYKAYVFELTGEEGLPSEEEEE